MPIVRVLLFAATLALAACATLLQPQPPVPQPWTPTHDLPEPGEGPPHRRN